MSAARRKSTGDEKGGTAAKASSPVSAVGFPAKITAEMQETRTALLHLNRQDMRGILVSRKLLVIKITEKKVYQGKLDLADFITHVNGDAIKSKEGFYNKLKEVVARGKHTTPVKVTFQRLKWTWKAEKNRFEQEIAGFSYCTSVMILYPGAVLGLNIRAYNNKVYVSRVEPCSLAARSIRIGDCILGVDEGGCTSVKFCLDKLNVTMRKDKAAILYLERPESAQAIEMVRCALRAQKTAAVDGALARDAVDIARRQIEKMRAGRVPPPGRPLWRPRSATRGTRNRSTSTRVSIKAHSRETTIGADPFNPIFMAKVPIKTNNPKTRQQRPSTNGPSRGGQIGGIGSFT